MNYLKTRPISIHLQGDKTNETFTGTFHVLERLSHRLELLKDRKYRELLGSDLQNASEDNKLRAEILAELTVAFTVVPDWFKDSGWGMDLVDNNILVKIYEEILKARKDVMDELQIQAGEATLELKKVVEAGKNK